MSKPESLPRTPRGQTGSASTTTGAGRALVFLAALAGLTLAAASVLAAISPLLAPLYIGLMAWLVHEPVRGWVACVRSATRRPTAAPVRPGATVGNAVKHAPGRRPMAASAASSGAAGRPTERPTDAAVATETTVATGSGQSTAPRRKRRPRKTTRLPETASLGADGAVAEPQGEPEDASRWVRVAPGRFVRVDAGASIEEMAPGIEQTEPAAPPTSGEAQVPGDECLDQSPPHEIVTARGLDPAETSTVTGGAEVSLEISIANKLIPQIHDETNFSPEPPEVAGLELESGPAPGSDLPVDRAVIEAAELADPGSAGEEAERESDSEFEIVEHAGAEDSSRAGTDIPQVEQPRDPVAFVGIDIPASEAGLDDCETFDGESSGSLLDEQPISEPDSGRALRSFRPGRSTWMGRSSRFSVRARADARRASARRVPGTARALDRSRSSGHSGHPRSRSYRQRGPPAWGCLACRDDRNAGSPATQSCHRLNTATKPRELGAKARPAGGHVPLSSQAGSSRMIGSLSN